MISNKLKKYIDVLDGIPDNQDKFLWIMDFGKNSPLVPERFKLKEFEVPGCQSQTWLVPHFMYDDKIYFTAEKALVEESLYLSHISRIIVLCVASIRPVVSMKLLK